MNPEQQPGPESNTVEHHEETMTALRQNVVQQPPPMPLPPHHNETMAALTGARQAIANQPEQKPAPTPAPQTPDRFAAIPVQPAKSPGLFQRALNFIGLGKKPDQGPAKEN